MSHVGWFITQIQYRIDIGTVILVGCVELSAHIWLINVLTFYNTLYSVNTSFSPDTAPPHPPKTACHFAATCSWVTTQSFFFKKNTTTLKKKQDQFPSVIFCPRWKFYLSSNEQILVNLWAASRSNSKGKCIHAWCYPVLTFSPRRPEGNVFRPCCL